MGLYGVLIVTTDEFNDEAQWKSYARLRYRITEQLFAPRATDAHEKKRTRKLIK